MADTKHREFIDLDHHRSSPMSASQEDLANAGGNTELQPVASVGSSSSNDVSEKRIYQQASSTPRKAHLTEDSSNNATLTPSRESRTSLKGEFFSVPRRSDSFLQVLAQEVATFLTVNYLLMWIPMLVVAVMLFFVSKYLGFAVVGFYFSPLCYFSNAEFKFGATWRGFLRSKFWDFVHAYMALRCRRLEAVPPGKSVIFAVHPHGIFACSRVAFFGRLFERMFPGVEGYFLGARPQFLIPGCREIALWLGGVDASKSVASRILDQGKSLFLFPGGSKEIFMTDGRSRETTLFLRSRKGFVKLALQKGCPLVPVLTFQEKWLHKGASLAPKRLEAWVLQKLRTPLVICYGKWFTLLPFQQRTVTVPSVDDDCKSELKQKNPLSLGILFGSLIQLPKIENPTQEELDKYHSIYCAQLLDLWDLHKEEFGYDASELLRIE